MILSGLKFPFHSGVPFLFSKVATRRAFESVAFKFQSVVRFKVPLRSSLFSFFLEIFIEASGLVNERINLLATYLAPLIVTTT